MILCYNEHGEKMSIFNSIGFGAYGSNSLGAEEDDWDSYFTDTTEETIEDSIKMQAQMALDAGMTMEELKLDPDWARAQMELAAKKKGMTNTQKIAIGGAVLGVIIILIFALKPAAY